MIACSGNLASRSVALSGPGGSAYVARSAKKMRDVWRDTPSGAMVHSSDSDIALSSCVSTPSRARHPCPSGVKLLIFLPMSHESSPPSDPDRQTTRSLAVSFHRTRIELRLHG